VFESMHKKVWKQAEASGAAGKMRKMMQLAQKTRLFNNQKAMRKIFAQIHTSLGNRMELFIAGGAAINPQVIKDYEAMGLPMIQGYGMTENAPIIAVNRDYYSKAESVGKPMPGTEVRIINQDADGVGEIICKGPSVMIGYYNDPEATAEVLRAGWLYTGDYGRFDDEGFLYIAEGKRTSSSPRTERIYSRRRSSICFWSSRSSRKSSYTALSTGRTMMSWSKLRYSRHMRT
ncbi:MAG: AMP-binding protein, partial [Clostridia bacterium]